MKIYPRVFICSNSYIKKSGGPSQIWLKYAVVREKGGRIFYWSKRGEEQTFKDREIEINADFYVKSGDWKELPPKETALII